MCSAFVVPGDPNFGVPLGRGGHQMLAVKERNGDPYLWVVGGRGGDNSVNGGEEVCFLCCVVFRMFVLCVSISGVAKSAYTAFSS